MTHRMIALGLLLGVWLSCTPLAKDRPANSGDGLTHQTWRGEARFRARLDFDALDYPRLQEALFYASNAARVRAGMAVLARHARLDHVAQAYARRMVRNNFFSHHDASAPRRQRTAQQRVQAAGVSNPHTAENLAIYFGIKAQPRESLYPLKGKKGQFSRKPNGAPIPHHTYLSLAESVIAFWLASPSHRENLLSADGVEIGCGASFYWDKEGIAKFKLVQVFQWFEPVKL